MIIFIWSGYKQVMNSFIVYTDKNSDKFIEKIEKIYDKKVKKMNLKEILMRKAIKLSIENIDKGGGPFGAVIADKEGEIIATGVNRVTSNNDPTAHAEIIAIRTACKKLDTFDLSGYDIYSSCEPCPMCLGAIYWAHIDNLYFGNSKKDAAKINFDDSFIYEELSLNYKDRHLKTEVILADEARKGFEKWKNKTDKTEY